MQTLIHPRSATSLTWTAAGSIAVAVVVASALSGPWWLVAGVASALGVAWVAAAADAATGRIPDRVVLSVAAPTLAVVVVAVLSGGHRVAAGSALGLLLIAGPLLLVHLVSPASMGFGDVKLGAALGAVVGVVDPESAVLALCVASAVTVGAAIVGRRSSVPFGPGLVLGAACSLVVFGAAAGGPVPWR